MDRGEFQQDSVLKQLEVLKEEEKEFQNLKVSIPHLHPQPCNRMWLKGPPVTSVAHSQGSCIPRCWVPISMPKGHPCIVKDALVPTVMFAGPSAP